MKAIFTTGGKQYLVTEGDTIYVEKLDAKENEEITFDNVLMVDNVVGTPNVKGAKVIFSVDKQGKNKKITIFRYVQKNKFRKKQGHRQPYTKLTVKSISK